MNLVLIMYLDRMSTLADISCISNVSMIQTTHLNETSSTTQNRKSTDEFETTVESIDLTKSTSDLFLDGCKVQGDVCLGGGGGNLERGRENAEVAMYRIFNYANCAYIESLCNCKWVDAPICCTGKRILRSAGIQKDGCIIFDVGMFLVSQRIFCITFQNDSSMIVHGMEKKG